MNIIYDVDESVNIQKPYASFILNEDTCLWESPVPYPTDGEQYTWNEEDLQWSLVAAL